MSANPNTLRVGPVAVEPKGTSSAVCDRPAGARADREDLQSLLAFSAMHGQVRRDVARTVNISASPNFAPEVEQIFPLQEVLQLVTERAVKITKADGIAMALAEQNGVAVRAQAGEVRPDIGQTIELEASFSSICFRTGQLLICEDTENDERVNRVACASLGARSLLAVPIRGRRGVVGILEAFSKKASAFDGTDARQLTLLSELVTGALTAEDEECLAKCAQAVIERLQPAPVLPKKPVANSMLRSSLTLPGLSNTGMEEQPDVPHRSFAAAIPSIVETRPVPLPAEAAPPIAPRPESREPHNSSTVFLTWFVVIAGAFVVGFGWRIGTSPKLSGVGLQVSTAHSASVATPNQPSTRPAKPASAVETSTARNVESKPNESIQDLRNFSHVTGIQYRSNGDSTTVMIASDSPVQYKGHRLADPERIFFDLAETRLAQGLGKEPIEVSDTLLKRIRAAQTDAGVTRVVLETNGKADYSITPEANPSGLKIELRKRNPAQP